MLRGTAKGTNAKNFLWTPGKIIQKHGAVLLSLLFCGIVFVSLHDYGVTWDEGVYFRAADSYWQWLQNPSWKTIDDAWKINSEHPPVVKILGGIGRHFFHEKLPALDLLPSYRVVLLIFVFLANYCLFRLAAELFGLPVAFITTLLFFFLPRIFFHAHLLAMDYAVMAVWVAALYAFWKGIKDPGWLWAVSFLLGLGLLLKINAFMIYIPILFSWFFLDRKPPPVPSEEGRIAKKTNISQWFKKILILFGIPPILFIAGWPWVWPQPFHRILDFLSFHFHHPPVYTYYLGMQTPLPPWHYPFVLTLATVPLITLIPFFIGLVWILIRPSRVHGWVLFNALFPLVVIAFPSTPKYDGVRLFLPAFPFICLIAGMGVWEIGELAKRMQLERKFYFLFAFLFALTLYFSIVKIHPYQSSYFNEIVGGLRGAQKMGLETECWGNAYIGVLPWMNDHSDQTFWIYMADLEPRILWGFDIYKRDGLLKPSVKLDSRQNSDYLVLLIRQGFFNEEMWRIYRTQKPVFSVRLSSVDLVSIYPLPKLGSDSR